VNSGCFCQHEGKLHIQYYGAQGITANWAKDEGARPAMDEWKQMGGASALQMATVRESWHGEAPEHLSLSNNRGHNARESQATNISNKSGLAAQRNQNEKQPTTKNQPSLPRADWLCSCMSV